MAAQRTGEELEKLFLLELLVDKVELDWTKIELDKEELSTLKQMCIRFQFLNYPVLEICEEDFCVKGENEEEKSEVTFKNGKSCLFSLRNCTPVLQCFLIRATVLRKKEEPPHQILGKACIKLGQNFTNVINTLRAEHDVGPFSETVKDKYSITTPSGLTVGKITLFVRLSSFGKMIITEFQISDEENKTFFFKNEDTKITEVSEVPGGNTAAYSLRQEAGDENMVQRPGADAPLRTISSKFVNVSCDPVKQPITSSYQYPTMDNAVPTMRNRPGPMSPFGASYIPNPGMMNLQPEGPMPTMQGSHAMVNMQPPMNMMNAQSRYPPFGPQAGVGMQRRPEDLLGGAGGLLGGSPFSMGSSVPNFPMASPGLNPMDISITKKQMKQKFPNFPFCGRIPITEDSSSSDEEEDTPPRLPPPSMPLLNLCECDYPLPPGFGVPCPPPLTQMKKTKKKKKKKAKCSLDIKAPGEDVEPVSCTLWLREFMEMTKKILGGNYALRSEDVLAPRSYAPYSPHPYPMGYPTFGGMPQTQRTHMPPGTIALKEDQVIFQMGPPKQTAMPFGDNVTWDPNDMFSMRVGRKFNANDQNTKVELQYEPPPQKKICKIDTETQYLPADFGGPESGNGDQGKNKKGKGGKKGKK